MCPRRGPRSAHGVNIIIYETFIVDGYKKGIFSLKFEIANIYYSLIVNFLCGYFLLTNGTFFDK